MLRQLDHEVRAALADHQRWGAVTAMLGASTSLPSLNIARSLLDREYRLLVRTGHADELRSAAAAASMGAPDSVRQSRARSLGAALEREAVEPQLELDHRLEPPLAPSWTAPWSAAFTRGLVSRALLASAARADGLGGIDATAPAFDAGQRLNALGSGSVAVVVLALGRTSDPARFYRTFDAARRATDPSLSSTFRAATPCVPRLRPDTVRIERDARYRRAWEGLCRSFGADTALFDEFVSASPRVKREMRAAVAAPDQAMEILFESTMGADWHVDVRTPGGAAYLPAVWLSPAGCSVRLERARRDLPLVVVLNAKDRYHVVTGDAGASACVPGQGATVLLSAPEGDIPFPGGRSIHYHVVHGWAPPAVPGGTP
jgi:hypothetical protein